MEEKESTLSNSGTSDTQSPPAPISTFSPPTFPPPPPPSSAPQTVMMNFAMVETATNGGGGGAPSAAPPATVVATPGSGVEGGATGGVPPGTMVATPGGSGGGCGGSGSGKRRGRPRKYDADGNLLVQYQTGAAMSTPLSSPHAPPGFSFSGSSSSGKRGRGRPPGSCNRQSLASLGELFASTAGGDFTPHVVTVNTGEDVAGKILTLPQKAPRGICILSANGAVSNVTIRQPGSFGGFLTYEGRFEILSLTGSFTVADKGGERSRTGGMSVSLAGPDGRVIGGGIAGSLTAASPIQIVVGSFSPNGCKAHKKKHQREYTLTSSSPTSAHEPVTIAAPISQSRPEGGISVTPASELLFSGLDQREASQATHGTVSEGQALSANPSHTSLWNGSETTPNQGPSPDINILAPSE